MIYIMDEKDVSALSDGTLKLAEGDVVKIFVKDMEKPILSAATFNAIGSLDVEIEFVQASSKDELIFLIGSLAGSGSDCTLVQMDLSIPAMFAKHVKVLMKKEKAAKPKKPRQPRKPKAESVPAVQDAKPVESVPETVAKEPETPSESTSNDASDASDTAVEESH